MNKLTIAKIASISFFLMNTACGGKDFNWVKDADIQSYQSNGEVYGELITYLDTGGMQLPSIMLPILNPKNPSQTIGQFALRSNFGADYDSELFVQLNISKIANIPGVGRAPRLPNGSAIPVGGIDTNKLLMLEVGGTKTLVYVSIDTQAKQGMLGAAVPIKQFDTIGSTLPGVNIFPTFNVGNNIRGTFGIFTGAGSGQNGFALFIDASGLLQNKAVTTLLAANNNSTTLFSEKTRSISSHYSTPMEYLDVAATSRDENTVGQHLYRLMKKRARLSLH